MAAKMNSYLCFILLVTVLHSAGSQQVTSDKPAYYSSSLHRIQSAPGNTDPRSRSEDSAWKNGVIQGFKAIRALMQQQQIELRYTRRLVEQQKNQMIRLTVENQHQRELAENTTGELRAFIQYMNATIFKLIEQQQQQIKRTSHRRLQDHQHHERVRPMEKHNRSATDHAACDAAAVELRNLSETVLLVIQQQKVQNGPHHRQCGSTESVLKKLDQLTSFINQSVGLSGTAYRSGHSQPDSRCWKATPCDRTTDNTNETSTIDIFTTTPAAKDEHNVGLKTSKNRQLQSVHLDSNQTLRNIDSFVARVAVFNNSLYFGYKTVSIYDVKTLTFQGHLIPPNADCNAIDMSSCMKCKFLYVLYASPTCNLSMRVFDQQGHLFQWPIDNATALSLYFLSATYGDNVLMVSYLEKILREFTPQGQLIRVIHLEDGIIHPKHAVQLDDGNFVLAHGSYDSDPHQVSIINGTGHIIQSYGGRRGLGIGQFNVPNSLMILGQSLLVADCYNGRLLLFKLKPLSFVKELTNARAYEPYPKLCRFAINDEETKLFLLYSGPPQEVRVYNLTWI